MDNVDILLINASILPYLWKAEQVSLEETCRLLIFNSDTWSVDGPPGNTIFGKNGAFKSFVSNNVTGFYN